MSLFEIERRLCAERWKVIRCHYRIPVTGIRPGESLDSVCSSDYFYCHFRLLSWKSRKQYLRMVHIQEVQEPLSLPSPSRVSYHSSVNVYVDFPFTRNPSDDAVNFTRLPSIIVNVAQQFGAITSHSINGASLGEATVVKFRETFTRTRQPVIFAQYISIWQFLISFGTVYHRFV